MSVYLLSHPTIVVRLLAMFLVFLLFRMSWRVIVIVLSVTSEVPHCKNFTTIYTYTYAHTTHTHKIHPCRACTHAHVHAHTYMYTYIPSAHTSTQCTHACAPIDTHMHTLVPYHLQPTLSPSTPASSLTSMYCHHIMLLSMTSSSFYMQV